MKKINNTSFIAELNRNKAFLMMALPGLIWFFIFRYLPMFGIVIAFKNFKLFGRSFIQNLRQSDWVGFKNFEFLFKTSDAWIITRNTLGYNIVFIIIGLTFSIFLAIALNEITNKRMAKIYQTLMFLPYFLSWVVVSYLVYAFLSVEKGLLNNILIKMGREPVYWYTEPHRWPPLLIFINTWKWAGYNCIIFMASIYGIDKTFYEAAQIDGAGKLRQIMSITLPFLKPLILILAILAIGRIFYSDFGLFYNVPKPNSGALFPVTNVIDTYVFRSLQRSSNIGMPAAAGVYQSICGFILVLTSNRIVKHFSEEHALF